MDITTATPAQIDTRLAGIYRRAMQAHQQVLAAAVSVHHALGEKPRYLNRKGDKAWPTTDAQAIDAARTRGDEYNISYGKTFADMVARYDSAVDVLTAIEAEADILDAEFARRGGWSRFFTVKQHNGHIHSSMSCSTCNRGRYRTEFGWNPELSGMSMAEAITHFDRYAYRLCTVCFPAAPVEWTVRPAADGKCVGVPYRPGSGTRVGMRTYADCPDCGSRELVNVTAGTMRAHKTREHA
ncbi:hypothetical protein [Micromonospora sp. WMMD737]|uniref:hypothetical protein n=1 Tax=Micromonospora sp. WMMD737 TaxID=3404113 RepID=UPI003B932F08